jgi:hypothetical protein
LRRADDGCWEVAQQSEIKLERNASLLTNERGLEFEAKLETIHHLPDNSQTVKVVVDVKNEAGNAFNLEDLKNVTPGLKKLGGSITVNQYEAVQLEYTVNMPLETAKKMIESSPDGINWQALHENSSLIIRGKTGEETGLGGSAQLGLATQKIGIGGEANVVRESSREIYRSN